MADVKGRRNGTIEISVSYENGRIMISVHDDGIGFPTHFDPDHTTSLGMQLIKALVQHQLKGSIMIMNQNGTDVRIEFPVSKAGV